MEEIHPPIKERSTEQLIEIVETKQKWREEVVKLAQSELVSSGVSIDEQNTKRKSRKKRESNYKRRNKAIKANASYSNVEKLLIVLFGPFTIFLLGDFNVFNDDKAYKKRNRQSWFYLLLGGCLWMVIIYIIDII